MKFIKSIIYILFIIHNFLKFGEMLKSECDPIEFSGKNGVEVFSIDFNSTKSHDSALFCFNVKYNRGDSEKENAHNWTGLMTLIIHINSLNCDHCKWLILEYMRGNEEIVLNSTGVFNRTTKSVCFSHEIHLDWVNGVSIFIR